MKHLFVLANNVWNADDYLNGRNCDPLCTDLYLFSSQTETRDFASALSVSNDIYNEGFIVEGTLDESKILELTGCDRMEDFCEMLNTPYSKKATNKNYGENEKTKVAEYIFSECGDTMKSIECANYDFKKSLEGAILVFWSWEKHIGYARKFIEIRRGDGHDTEELLTKQDRVFVAQCDAVMSKEEVEKCDDLESELIDRLLIDKSWKWTNEMQVSQEISNIC